MRQEGTVISWKDDKGFGFIQPAQPGADIFFNIANFRSAANTRPALRMRVSFEVIHVGGKGPRAMAVRPVGEGAARPSPGARRSEPARRASAAAKPRSGALLALPLMLAYYALMVAAVLRGGLPAWVLAASFLVNLLTFYLYWQDKHKAGRQAWRISENTLHAWSFVGGWPGAWLAQQLLRHKSAKVSFRVNYWLGALLHVAAFVAVLWYLGMLPRP